MEREECMCEDLTCTCLLITSQNNYKHKSKRDSKYYVYVKLYKFLSDFDRASPLICGNKMPTRCNRSFLSQILLLAQHVSGTIMPIIRSSRVLYCWLLPVVFGALVFKLSVWCGAEGYVSGKTAARKPDT
jgi:hypothetical protein